MVLVCRFAFVVLLGGMPIRLNEALEGYLVEGKDERAVIDFTAYVKAKYTVPDVEEFRRVELDKSQCKKKY